MQPRFNIWIENEGDVVISHWRARLLEAIDRTGSITAAARELDVPYRRAWERIQEMERSLGGSLVTTEIGGSGGGGAQLTPAGQDLLSRFHAFTLGFEEEISARYKAVFRGFAGQSNPA